MEPRITQLNYTYKKPDANVRVFNSDDLPLAKEQIVDQQFVYLGPKTLAGNHKHPRTEWFIGIGDLVLYWLDKNDRKHEVHMNPNGQLLLIKIPSNLPHAVQNKSETNFGILMEYADDKKGNIIPIKLV